MPVDAWRSPPVWDSMWAAKDENRKSSVIDPLLGCRHSGSPPPRRPGLCRPQWSLDAKGWVGRVTIHGTESPSAPSTSPVACQCSCPTQAFGWGRPPPGDLPSPRIEPASLRSPALAGRFFTTCSTWEALIPCLPEPIFPPTSCLFIPPWVLIKRLTGANQLADRC